MSWATVSSWSCFCWLYRASLSLAAKNIINLISVLTIWWCPCVVLSAMEETQILSLGWEDPLEKEMATHCSILAWRIPWSEEPGGLQSLGLQRVGHDWATNTFTFHPSVAHLWTISEYVSLLINDVTSSWDQALHLRSYRSESSVSRITKTNILGESQEKRKKFIMLNSISTATNEE